MILRPEERVVKVWRCVDREIAFLEEGGYIGSCQRCGRCCRVTQMPPRLTFVEYLILMRHCDHKGIVPSGHAENEGCPFLLGKPLPGRTATSNWELRPVGSSTPRGSHLAQGGLSCTVYESRPLQCRLYFCPEIATAKVSHRIEELLDWATANLKKIESRLGAFPSLTLDEWLR